MPIIALTANALGHEEQRCRDAGMDGYLVKPVRLAQLRTTIDAHLGMAGELALSAGREVPAASVAHGTPPVPASREEFAFTAVADS